MTQFEIMDALQQIPGEWVNAKEIEQITGFSSCAVTTRMKALRKWDLVNYKVKSFPKTRDTFYYRSKC